jgi:hypothetical protein
MLGKPEGIVNYSLDGDGVLHAELSTELTHDQLLRELADRGFRLPTSDEWEYACAAGSRTLFRWGDHAPLEEVDDAIEIPLERRELSKLWTDPEYLAKFREWQAARRSEPIDDAKCVWFADCGPPLQRPRALHGA